MFQRARRPLGIARDRDHAASRSSAPTVSRPCVPVRRSDDHQLDVDCRQPAARTSRSASGCSTPTASAATAPTRTSRTWPAEMEGSGEVRFVIDSLDLVEGTYKLDVAAHRARRLPVRLPSAAPHVPREVAHQGRRHLPSASPVGVLALRADRPDAEAMSERKIWTPTDVVDVSGPPALLRNYLEQRDVRDHLARASLGGPIRPRTTSAAALASDAGARGAGRTCDRVRARGVAHRDGQASAARLRFIARRVSRAAPVADAIAQFVMIFTVLQHMPDSNAATVIREIMRVLAPGGFVLVVEETDPTLEAGDVARAEFGYTKGRSWSWYAQQFEPLQPIRMAPRTIEPGYPRADVGTLHALRAGMSAALTRGGRRARSRGPSQRSHHRLHQRRLRPAAPRTRALPAGRPAEGDALIVGVNSDRSVRATRDPTGP